MIENIAIREAVTEEERSLFWERLRAYFCRDIFPDPEDKDRPYYLGDDYRRTMESLHTRPVHPVHWLVFSRNGQDVGFALAAVFTGEDGKCFILEFCVLPEHRGGGMGTACARTLLNWAREQGAGYAELNCTTPPRQRFWGRLGFVANGADEWGVPLMLLPPREHRPITVERLTDPTDWQLGKLENGYRQDIGEEPLTEEQQERLTQAIREGRITFLVARRDGRAVGMCSVAEIFSTFACGPVGQLEDFYVEPVFRRRGVARQLVQAAQALCRERSIASLTVCCAPCDEAMHRALGFTAPLGRTLAWLPEE